MKTKKKFLLMLLFLIFFLLILNGYSYGYQRWNSLDYDATLNTDGSMEVVETWNIYISETNTLFKDFNLDSSKYSEITDVRVACVEDDIEKNLFQIYEEQYHVSSGCYYALPLENNSRIFEIAWNVGLDESSDTRTYKIYYTIKDVIKQYEDCSELYWQFLGTENSISGKNVTGTIHLPKGVTNIEKLRVWAHGDLEGVIERTSTDTVNFSLPKLSANSMLEIRVVTEENIFEECTRRVQTQKLEKILEEEQQWADDANKTRNKAKMFIFAMFVVNMFCVVFFSIKAVKYIKEGKTLNNDKKDLKRNEIQYFRDIPDEENATPARAIYFYSNANTGNIQSSALFSSTLLDLCLKGIIEFEQINEKDFNIINKGLNDIVLTKDEKIVYKILESALREKDRISTKEFSKYSKQHYESIHSQFTKIQETVALDAIKLGKIDENKKKMSEKILNKFIIYIFAMFFSVFLAGTIYLIALPIMCAICAIILLINLFKISILSETGKIEHNEWKGLERYMKDYSLLKEKQVPDIVLWEKYLVYATAFGISKEVIKQLKVVHPEMFDPNNSTYSNRGYWYIMSSPTFGSNGFDNLNKSLSDVYKTASNAYSAAHSSSSSGSGSGGGFSGGGGGRRRRRWLWRSLNPIKIKHLIYIRCFLLLMLDFFSKI